MSNEEGSPSLAPHRVRLDDLPSSPGAPVKRKRSSDTHDAANTTFGPISFKEMEMQSRLEYPPDSSDLFELENSENDDRAQPQEECGHGGGGACDAFSDNEGEDQDDYDDQDDGNASYNHEMSTTRRTVPGGSREHHGPTHHPRVGAACVFDTEEEDGNLDHASTASEESIPLSGASRGPWTSVFPDVGVRCVGCNLCNSISKVDQFIEENLMRMDEDSLFKLAALVYKREVVIPVTAEGNEAPEWGWREIQTHYTFHAVNHRLKRKSYVNQLTAVRMHLERGMVRITDNDGEEEREVDGGKVDRYLKVVALESKERQLLENTQRQGRR